MKQESLLHKISLAIVPPLVAWLMKVWFLTCRITEHNTQNRKQCREYENPVIATFWHHAILFVFYHMRRELVAAVVSASTDGEYIARLGARFGFKSVRGSRNRRGMQVLKESMKYLAEGWHMAIVADGSQGPALKVQAGSIFLASKSGSPILPMTWSASRYWIVPSWDRMVIPKPFSRINLFYGKPVHVPKDVKGEKIEEYRQQVENNLNEIYEQAWALYGKQQH
jgi:lysophospholipid acyltransferase (LPLAT)-like uncharacterized protein